MKLEKALKVVKREQHDFGHVLLAKPVERNVEGIRIEKEHTPSRNGNRRDSDAAGPRRGCKTIWVDEREDGGECSVEAMCLGWYRDQGWKGYHSEGGIVRTLFGFLFLRHPLHLHTQRLPNTLPDLPAGPPHRRLLPISSFRNQSPPK